MAADERLRLFKPEGAEYQYCFCIICDKDDDETMLLQEFGICRDCCKKILETFPDSRYAQIGRLLLYASRKQLFLGDASKRPRNENKEEKVGGEKHRRPLG